MIIKSGLLEAHNEISSIDIKNFTIEGNTTLQNANLF